jgi:hypothetical protein
MIGKIKDDALGTGEKRTMDGYPEPKKKSLLEPILVFVVVLGLIAYGVVTLVSGDALWFLGGTSLPKPTRIVIRVEGEETVLTSNSPGYDIIADATKTALSSFVNSAPIPLGLSDETLEGYQHRFTVLELYYDEPVDFHLPFNDGQPTALLIPIQGRHAGHNYVFRGGNGEWWARPLKMTDIQPIYNALSVLGYIELAALGRS